MSEPRRGEHNVGMGRRWGECVHACARVCEHVYIQCILIVAGLYFVNASKSDFYECSEKVLLQVYGEGTRHALLYLQEAYSHRTP